MGRGIRRGEPNGIALKDESPETLPSQVEAFLRFFLGPNTPIPIEAAAWYLDLSVNHVYRLTSTNRLTCYKPNGKRLYFLKRDLDAYALRNEVLADDELEREAATRSMNGIGLRYER